MRAHTYNSAYAFEKKHEGFTPQDPISCITHFIGAALGVVGTFMLVIKATSMHSFDIVKTFSTLVFGISLVLLYSASALYHYASDLSPHKKALRRLDHSMIYVLIAGSYTPVLLNMPNSQKGKLLTALIWLIAAVGVGLKVFVAKIPRTFSTVCYIAMGWFILIDLSALLSLGTSGIILLALGGVCYTAGGVIYAIKKPNISEKFGFHEVFHLFVMAGSLFHFLNAYLVILK